ncbi:MAG: AAA family ATPase [Bacteroidota bacterium]
MPAHTILLIDPDAASRNFVSNALRQHGYAVLLAASAAEGLAAAARDRPDLIVAEPVLPDLSGEELAAKLRQDPRTVYIPLIALSRDDRATRLRSCFDAGFRDYIVKSSRAVPDLIETVDGLLARTVEPAAPRRHALSFVFLSAKGGIGTSSLCANLAMNIATNYSDALVALVDMVLPIGSIASIVGYDGHQNLVSLARAVSEKSDAPLPLPEVPLWRVHLLAGCPDPESASQLHVEAIPGILERLRAAYDYVILDTGRSLSKFTVPLIQASDVVVLVVSPDLSSITLTKTVLGYLQSKGVESGSIYTILNRAVGLEGLSRPEAEKALGLEIQSGIPYLPYFSLANNLHQPYALKFPNETASVAFRDVARQMVEMARHVRANREVA